MKKCLGFSNYQFNVLVKRVVVVGISETIQSIGYKLNCRDIFKLTVDVNSLIWRTNIWKILKGIFVLFQLWLKKSHFHRKTIMNWYSYCSELGSHNCVCRYGLLIFFFMITVIWQHEVDLTVIGNVRWIIKSILFLITKLITFFSFLH